MTDSHPFFRVVWRANALLILGVLALVGSWAAYNMARDVWRSRAFRPARNVEVPVPSTEGAAAAREPLRIGTFARIDARTFTAPLYEGPPDSYYKSASLTKIRNVLFLDAETGAVRRLFPDDTGRVVLQDDISRRSGERGESRVVARVVIHVPADSNGDGVLDRRDQQRLVAIRPDGTGMVTLAEGIESYRAETVNESELAVLAYFIRRDDELHYAEFDLTSFKPGRTFAVRVPRT